MGTNSKRVGARELKTRLGRYLRLVAQGTEIVVTKRGRPVARLTRLCADDGTLAERLDAMAARGELTLARAPELPEVTPLPVRGALVSEAVVEQREDRL